jgi:hypothetical protein
MRNVHLYILLIFFKNCKLIYTDISCESIDIKDNKISELFKSTELGKPFKKTKMNIMQKMKKLRGQSMKKVYMVVE